jgi:hypothetical protein
MSMISSNNAKEANTATAAATSAVTQAAATAQAAVSQAESVAGSLTTQSIAASTQTTGSSTSSNPVTQSTNSSVASNAAQTSVVNIGGIKLPGSTGSLGSTYLSVSNSESSLTISGNTMMMSSYNLKGPDTQQRSPMEDLPKVEGFKINGPTNFVNNNSTNINSTGLVEQKTDTVKKNVQDNSAAGGVSIAAIASVPVGFGQYSVSLTDAAFYAPKEIYKNQRTVDNARTQRLLNGASDKVYQQMLDQQYKIGN